MSSYPNTNPDTCFLSLAIDLAQKSNPFPNPRVGAVLVKNGQILGRGYHRAPGKPHAEILAIKDAKNKFGPDAAQGTTLYVSLEPCSHSHILKRTPPCTSTIIREGISKVVYAMKDPNPFVCGKGAKELRVSGIEVLGPTNEREARLINPEYIKNMKQKPFVSIKMAMSLDGKTATRTGDSKWISDPRSREYVHKLRGRMDAVMVGAGTVCKDNPKLTTRGKGHDPYRIIIDGKLRIPLESKVLGKPDRRTIVVTSEDAPKAKCEDIRKRQHLLVCGKRSEVDLKKLVWTLGAMGIKKIMIEGGSELNAKALEAGIVDRMLIFIAPKLIGGRDAKAVIGGSGIERMAQALALGKMKIKRIGPDILIEARVR